MKSKDQDQRLLEEAYNSILNPNVLLTEGMFDSFAKSVKSFADKHTKALLVIASGAAIALGSFGIIHGEKEYEQIANTVKQSSPEDYKRLEDAKKQYDTIRNLYMMHSSDKNSSMGTAMILTYQHLEDIIKEMKQKYPTNHR